MAKFNQIGSVVGWIKRQHLHKNAENVDCHNIHPPKQLNLGVCVGLYKLIFD
ncbi:hypothetical protein THIOM_000774 [Candidatus Thiomargarita nelsonii]|uniref:Uncharacterized protein n=1 Tax=Candidatus Thiomargarita nelsonii TaxID=1003181 RepID=A0A176S606_9GAMM|nr:hypothetical protein THIOM_000774 [Candidatus Thiomargarita nelsonii]